ncbi:MAG TPA: hypothetical protein VGM88_14775 [Kofleriaceae bacterium]|jgi:hypothetical protein
MTRSRDLALAAGVLALGLGCDVEEPRDVGCELPPRDCVGKGCADLVRFTPVYGPGYMDVPVAGEDTSETSTSYVRRDLRALIEYAAARVDCVAAEWTPGEARPLVLGDASDQRGRTPGSRTDAPRHPRHTHVHGRDIDLGYYQTGAPDNQLRAICAHVVDGVDVAHCIAPPDHLDAMRTALFIGTLYESPRIRTIGVDGQAAAPILAAIGSLCARGIVTPEACERVHLAYEAEDTGLGWFLSHHGHLHVSVLP